MTKANLLLIFWYLICVIIAFLVAVVFQEDIVTGLLLLSFYLTITVPIAFLVTKWRKELTDGTKHRDQSDP